MTGETARRCSPRVQLPRRAIGEASRGVRALGRFVRQSRPIRGPPHPRPRIGLARCPRKGWLRKVRQSGRGQCRRPEGDHFLTASSGLRRCEPLAPAGHDQRCLWCSSATHCSAATALMVNVSGSSSGSDGGVGVCPNLAMTASIASCRIVIGCLPGSGNDGGGAWRLRRRKRITMPRSSRMRRAEARRR
jgi:hypothetical protein